MLTPKYAQVAKVVGSVAMAGQTEVLNIGICSSLVNAQHPRDAQEERVPGS